MTTKSYEPIPKCSYTAKKKAKPNGFGLGRRHRIKPVSEDREARFPARRECLKKVRERSGGKCEAKVRGVCVGVMQTGHEPAKQGRGADFTDPAQVMAICHACHRWTHDNEAEATRRGLLIPKNKAIPDGSQETRPCQN